MFKKNFFLSLVFSLSAFFVVSSRANFYGDYPRFDVPIHFLGGLVAALFFVLFFEKTISGLPAFSLAVFVFGGTALAGVLWEFTEWATDRFLPALIPGFHVNQLGLNDTLGDLLVDLLGAAALLFFYFFRFNFAPRLKNKRHV